MNDFSLEGKVALVTGSSSGMGRATAKVFAKYGAKVFIGARREHRLQELKAEIEADGGIAEYMVCDVSKEENCRDIVASCVEKFGKLDIMFNAAGVGEDPRGPELGFDTAQMNAIIGTDLYGYLFMIKHSYPEIAKSGGGSIISVSSISAIKTYGLIAYAAAKGGYKSTDKSLALLLGPMNIRVNSIYPGAIDTEMTFEAFSPPEVREALNSVTPLGRVGKPEDIAFCALYLASDVSSYVSGQAFVVDGGVTC